MKAEVAIAFLLLCFGADTAWGLRCGRHLVVVGDSENAVRSRRGGPDRIDQQVSYEAVPDGGTCNGAPTVVYLPVITDLWLYNFGPRRFIQELSFRKGRLEKIRSLGYGE